jgi:hypothetical protein
MCERIITYGRNSPFVQIHVKEVVGGFSGLRRASAAQGQALLGATRSGFGVSRAWVIFEKDKCGPFELLSLAKTEDGQSRGRGRNHE